MNNRIQHIRKQLKDKNLDALIVTKLSNIRYLTNFSGSNATLVIKARNLVFITDGRYTEQAREELFELPRLRTYIERNAVECLGNNKVLNGCANVGIEAENMTLATFNNYKKALKTVRLKATHGIVEASTRAKTAEEVENIRKAAEIADAAYQHILGIVKPGMRERDLAAELSYKMKMLGSEHDAFDIIVASGVRGALPHGVASDKKIRKNEMVTLDFGARYKGFNSDMTRTFVVGKAGKLEREVFDTVHRAFLASIEAAAIGMQAADLDAVARNIIREAGYGEAFSHSLGHGLGIEVHERPSLSERAKKDIVEENCVITIEPGIYLSGRCGVRIEDDVYMHRDGKQILNKSPRELISV